MLTGLPNPENDTELSARNRDSSDHRGCLTRDFYAVAYSFSLRKIALPIDLEFGVSLSASASLPRKEVIQPHLPIRLPCYDFTPVIGLALGAGFLRLPHRLWALPTPMV